MTDELIIKGLKPSALPSFWLCRTWTKRPGTGWNTSAERFKTEDQAVAFGREHNRVLASDDISRYYEVYKEGTFNHGIRLH
ncbi:MAG: hypothetical protein IKE92_04620 [Clostridiales bacterium]|nr:hypothetical protein [Clostridiales bacterium]